MSGTNDCCGKRKSTLSFLPGELQCCGSPVRRAGYQQDFEQLKAKNLETFARFSVNKIITNCPGCYHTLKYEYQLDVYHTTQVLSEKGWIPPDQFEPDEKLSITYHDPCHLGRWSDIYEEPRRLLDQAGWQVVELADNRTMSLCCGAGGGVKSNYPGSGQRDRSGPPGPGGKWSVMYGLPPMLCPFQGKCRRYSGDGVQ